MDPIRRAGFALAALMVLCPAVPAAADEAWSADQQAVIDVLKDGPLGIDQDFESWESKFHPDWTVWFANQPEDRAKAPHMQTVRDYIGGGAVVTGYVFEPVDVLVGADYAHVRFNATETIREADGSIRVVKYGGTDLLVQEDGEWRIRATTVSFPSS